MGKKKPGMELVVLSYTTPLFYKIIILKNYKFLAYWVTKDKIKYLANASKKVINSKS